MRTEEFACTSELQWEWLLVALAAIVEAGFSVVALYDVSGNSDLLEDPSAMTIALVLLLTAFMAVGILGYSLRRARR